MSWYDDAVPLLRSPPPSSSAPVGEYVGNAAAAIARYDSACAPSVAASPTQCQLLRVDARRKRRTDTKRAVETRMAMRSAERRAWFCSKRFLAPSPVVMYGRGLGKGGRDCQQGQLQQ